jgi:hypothetical protein
LEGGNVEFTAGIEKRTSHHEKKSQLELSVIHTIAGKRRK